MMTGLKKFSDDVIKGKWARIIMDDGKSCYIAIGPRSIVIKESNLGIIGPKLFEVRNLVVIEQIIKDLIQLYPDDLTPGGMTNRILKPVVNAVMHCRQLEQAVLVLKSIENRTLQE